MGAIASLTAIAVGAVLRFATTFHTTVWNVKTVGDILMLTGGFGLIVALVAFAYWDGAMVRDYAGRSRTLSAESKGVVYSPTGYARTSYEANYPSMGAVPLLPDADAPVVVRTTSAAPATTVAGPATAVVEDQTAVL